MFKTFKNVYITEVLLNNLICRSNIFIKFKYFKVNYRKKIENMLASSFKNITSYTVLISVVLNTLFDFNFNDYYSISSIK